MDATGWAFTTNCEIQEKSSNLEILRLLCDSFPLCHTDDHAKN